MMFLNAKPLSFRVSAVGCLGGLSLWLGLSWPSGAEVTLPGAIAAADDTLNQTLASRAYTPPPGSQSAGGPNTGGGVRGCGDQMVALAPQYSVVGQSFSTRPTFVWYVGNNAVETLEFALYQRDEAGTGTAQLMDIEQEIAYTPNGYVAYTLPSDGAALTVGETYTWVAAVYCDAARTQIGGLISADIEIVAPPSVMPPEMDAVAAAETYGAEGFWYDALAAVYAGETAEAAALRQDLLLDLADLEENTGTVFGRVLGRQLRALTE